MKAYSQQLQTAAAKAWTWANAHPAVKWLNNDEMYQSKGIGAGQSDKSSTVMTFKVAAACYLYALTGQTVYKTAFEADYAKISLVNWSYAYKYESTTQDMMLYYTKLPNVTPAVRDNILSKYTHSMRTKTDNLPALVGDKDPYRGFITEYVWGSNSFLCRQGGMYYNMLTYNQDVPNHKIYKNGAYAILNKMHGTNPLGLVYLTNMERVGAEKSCTQLWHSWFSDGSAKWDEVGVSQYGPPLGYVLGGPNSNYKKSSCCPSSCGSTLYNAVCNSVPNLPLGQPQQKSFMDLNQDWPLNTWELTENANHYQASYIKLLSKFIVASTVTQVQERDEMDISNKIAVYPNPSQGMIQIHTKLPETFMVEVTNLQGQTLIQTSLFEQGEVDLSALARGMYFLRIYNKNRNGVKKIVISS
jgi:hypothetical protein